MKHYICYTDGSFKSLVNIGGWSSIITDENNQIIKELYSGVKNTTNNRMESLAVLETLKWFKEPTDLTIVSESMYVVNTINEGWAQKWFENKDYSKSNLDIWFQILDYLNFHKVKMEWTKGHANHLMNNRADELAQFATTCLNLPEDEYFIKSKKSGESLVSKSGTQRPDGSNVGFENGKITYSLG